LIFVTWVFLPNLFIHKNRNLFTQGDLSFSD